MNQQLDPQLSERIYMVVMQIPAGQVATYGDIARIVGGGIDGRTVGYALGDLSQQRSDQVPWQRVVSQGGGISTRGLSQREQLLAEGVAFDDHERVIMARCHWPGPDAEWANTHGFHSLPPRGEQAEQLPLL